jgi:hypothetical protein
MSLIYISKILSLSYSNDNNNNKMLDILIDCEKYLKTINSTMNSTILEWDTNSVSNEINISFNSSNSIYAIISVLEITEY